MSGARRVFRLEAVLEASVEELYDILFVKVEEMHQWNPSIQHIKVRHRPFHNSHEAHADVDIWPKCKCVTFERWHKIHNPNAIYDFYMQLHDVFVCRRFLSMSEWEPLSPMRCQHRQRGISLVSGISWVSDTAANTNPASILEEQPFSSTASHLRQALWGTSIWEDRMKNVWCFWKSVKDSKVDPITIF